MKIEEMAKIAALMSEHDLTEFRVESEDFSLKLKRGAEQTFVTAPVAVAQPAIGVPAPAVAAETAIAMGPTIASPIVGTFYASPSPDAGAFVKVGDTITPDTVVCIIEAMKVMNEIKAEQSGVIKKILADNGQPVEFDQPLFELS